MRPTADLAPALVELVREQHPEGLTADQLGEVRSAVAAQLAASERLRRFELTNDQEPVFAVRYPAGGAA
jgi:hypothetical protein